MYLKPMEQTGRDTRSDESTTHLVFCRLELKCMHQRIRVDAPFLSPYLCLAACIHPGRFISFISCSDFLN